MASDTPAVELPAKRNLKAKLRHEYEPALKDHDISVSRIQADLVQRAAEECHALTTAMYQKLPAELRQHVLQYVCIEEQAVPVGPKYHFKPYLTDAQATPVHYLAYALSCGERSVIDHSDTPDSALLGPSSYIFDKSYMGEAAASEVLEMYFANNVFSICTVEEGIASFLNGWCRQTQRPIWYNGPLQLNGPSTAKPIELVRKLQIRVKYEHYNTTLMQHFQRGHTSSRELFASECNLLRTSKDALSMLLDLPVKDLPVTIEFVIETAFSDGDGHSFQTELAGDIAIRGQAQRAFINLLEALRNTIYRLMYDHGNSVIKVVHFDETNSAFPRDITALWSLTKEQWEHEKSANIRNPDWTADFYLGFGGLDPQTHCGFSATERSALLRERWGIENSLQDRKPKWPIKEGRYWPVGNALPG